MSRAQCRFTNRLLGQLLHVSAPMRTLSVPVWGVENPNRKRRIVVVAAFVVISSSLLGYYWVDFIPSAEWNATVLVIAASLSLATLFWIARTLRQRPPADTRLRARLMLVWGCIVVAAVVSWFTWSSLAQGFGYLLTLAHGKETTRSALLNKVDDFGLDKCRFRLEGPALARKVPDHLCITGTDYERISKEGPFVLLGTESWFGFNVTSWRMER